MRFCPQEYLVPGPCKLCQRPRTWWQPSHLVRTLSSTPPPTIKNPMVFRRPCWMQNWKMIPASFPLPKPDTPRGNWLLGNEDSAIKSFISQYPVVPKGETICPNAAAKPLFRQSFFLKKKILLLLRFAPNNYTSPHCCQLLTVWSSGALAFDQSLPFHSKSDPLPSHDLLYFYPFLSLFLQLLLFNSIEISSFLKPAAHYIAVYQSFLAFTSL